MKPLPSAANAFAGDTQRKNKPPKDGGRGNDMEGSAATGNGAKGAPSRSVVRGKRLRPGLANWEAEARR